MISPKLTALLTIVTLALQAYASPISLPSDIPVEARTLALDERSGTLTAFDYSGREIRSWDDIQARSLEKRAPSACRGLSVDELTKLPGWDKLKKAAEKEWGNGRYELVVNPPDYRDRPATVCAQSEPVMIKADAPACQNNEVDMGGKLGGANGGIEVEITTGTNFMVSTTTTRESQFAVGMSATVGIGAASIGLSTSMTITNTLAKTESTEVKNQVKQKVRMDHKAGKSCELKIKTRTCTTKGTGRVRYTADGFAWFNYHDKTKDHYKWAMSLGTLSVEERSGYLDFDTMVNSETKTKYDGECKDTNAAGASATKVPVSAATKVSSTVKSGTTETANNQVTPNTQIGPVKGRPTKGTPPKNTGNGPTPKGPTTPNNGGRQTPQRPATRPSRPARRP